MIYLSLDQSLTSSGFAIFNDDKLIDCGKWATKKSQPIEQRLGYIWQQLSNLYDNYEFEYVYFEDCYKQPNIQTYQKLSMVKATILLWCYFNEIPCSCCEPSHWRKVIKTANDLDFGHAREENKRKAIQFVKEYFNQEVESDIADAICIGYAGYVEANNIKKSAF